MGENIITGKVLLIGDQGAATFALVRPSISHLSTKAYSLDREFSENIQMTSLVFAALKRLGVDVVWKPSLTSKIAKSHYTLNSSTTEVIQQYHNISSDQIDGNWDFDVDSFDLFVLVDYGLGTITQDLLDKLDRSKVFIIAPRAKNLQKLEGMHVLASRYMAENSYNLPDHKLYVLDEESVVEEDIIFPVPAKLRTSMLGPSSRPGALEAALASAVWGHLNDKNIAISALLGFLTYSITLEYEDRPYKFFGELLDANQLSLVYDDFLYFIKSTL